MMLGLFTNPFAPETVTKRYRKEFEQNRRDMMPNMPPLYGHAEQMTAIHGATLAMLITRWYGNLVGIDSLRDPDHIVMIKANLAAVKYLEYAPLRSWDEKARISHALQMVETFRDPTMLRRVLS